MRQITGFDGYDITPDGRVWSRLSEKWMRLHPNEKGYLKVRLRHKNGARNLFVHRLVAGEYLSKPADATEVNHKDGIKSNNQTVNLEWVSRWGNMQHAANNLGKKMGLAKGVEDRLKFALCLYNTGDFSMYEVYRFAKITAQTFRTKYPALIIARPYMLKRATLPTL